MCKPGSLIRPSIVMGALLLLLPIMSAWGATKTPERLHLLSQLASEHQDIQLSEQDWAWLRHKRKLTLGVSLPSFPPLDIVYSDGDYEGISADVAALLSQQLGIEISVLNLPDRAEALEALQAGTIDLLSGANNFELDAYPVALSRSYAEDFPAIFRRQGDSRLLPKNLSGATIAMAEDYRSSQEVQNLFPQARLVQFKSQTEAMAALAFEQVDVYLGDSLSAYYMVNQSFFNYVKFDRPVEMTSNGFSFAVKQDNTRLLQILNNSIDTLGQAKLSHIIKRWAGSGFVLSGDKVILSAQERRWIAQHPVVRMVVNDDLAPAAFFDANGNFNGIVADLFDIISLRTGLQFEVERTGSFNNLQRALKAGRADLAMLIPTPERETFLRFTHSFATSSFAVVNARSNKAFNGLQSLKGKRLAIAKGQAVIAQIRSEHPDIRLVTPATTLDSLSMVAEGKADAAMMPLSSARYYTSRLYDNTLQIAGITSGNEATNNFAMRRSDTELQSILNKVILSIPPDDMNSITNRWRANTAMSGQTWRDYREVIGEIIAVALTVVAIILLKVVFLRREIQKRVAAEQALNDQLQFLQTLSDAMPQPVYARDREGRMLSCTRSYEQALGLSLSDILGKTTLEMPIDCFETVRDFHRNYLLAMESGEPIQQRCEITLGNKTIWIDHWIQPFRDSGGTIKGVICGWLDTTEQHTLIEALRAAKVQAEDASRAKTTFLATMSHEIRTPMSAVIGTLELALKRADQGVLDRAGIEIARTAANNLLELIGDILDIVRIESGRLSLAPKRDNLRELVESVFRVFDGAARHKGLQLILDVDPNINGDVLIDPLRFKQVLSNLVSNAIKFSHEGCVKITVAGEWVEPFSLALTLLVEDSGIGISQEDQTRLFRPFAQVNQDPANARGGTGLGLVISRSLCEMMGGTLHMISIPGTGTRIRVNLTLTRLDPVPPRESSPPLTSVAPRHGRVRILVVDDHLMNRQLLLQQLQFLGYEAAGAENGEVALAAWRNLHCELIITDCHMPIMTGAELTLAIREEERLSGLTPTVILGLTADARQVDIERYLSIGMDDCLIKPTSLDELEARLSSFTFSRSSTHAHDAAKPQRVVNIEDDQDHIGINALSRLAGGNTSQVQELVRELLSSNRQDLGTLQLLLQKRDIRALRELSHRIRGAASVVKAEQLIARCREMEDACGSSDLSKLEEKAAQVEQAMVELERGFSLID
ncbi:transporter substrate-binding domain-containing protein [Pseudomonas sp. CCM 7893]|uniref:histidine kinase n=1 Tax=Pseudomonas spelaei TaxID=1055469 RepID=A0A6I3W8K1_9PSED|nr:transporter substrate-binding domain-containing protein [Pseudomonas spelaei]MUF03649.1 transporter substrate-binding domain-containing protein [Pseudomonas spelaei]